MSIKEEPIRIEFHYDPEDKEQDSFDLELQTIDGEQFLRITPSDTDTSFLFTTKFLVEVIDFLRKKEALTDKNITSKIEKDERQLSLDIPIISSLEIHKEEVTSTLDFPVSTFSSAIIEEEKKEKNIENKKEFTVEEPLIIKRETFRDRLPEDSTDVMGAEKSAASKRKVNPNKIIKKI
jgi:hypothetical protein